MRGHQEEGRGKRVLITLSRNLTSQAWVDHIQSRIDDTRTYQVMVMMVMIHQFHNRVLQSRRRPLLGALVGPFNQEKGLV